ncbi:MAG: hypothetical protein M0P31_02360 [Solirubrobacteraceae bacterium]|nr:hypothetical protein [Solirubrobacteraceae bacterium]
MSSILCLHLPRFALLVAAGNRSELLAGPVALAPTGAAHGGVGDVSAADEGAGVRPGLPLGEALARCPTLRLLPPDPVLVASRWEEVLARIESIGARVEVDPDVPGVAWLTTADIRRLHGGTVDGIVGAVRRAVGAPARIGVAPTRFLARIAAGRARSRQAAVVHDADVPALLRHVPVAALVDDPRLAGMVERLERLGLATLADVRTLPRAALGERFGRPGLLLGELLEGRDAPLRPRDAVTPLTVDLVIPEALSGAQLHRALALLVDRVVADPRRRRRRLRSLTLRAALVQRGTWQDRVVLREATADPARIRAALGLRLDLLPAPARRLALRVDGFGDPVRGDLSLLDEDVAVRRARLREAVRQVRQVAGPEGALRIVDLDPGSRVAERRMGLTPFEP